MRGRFGKMNRGMVMLWRLGPRPPLDVWPSGSGQILVLVHIGRRAGRRLAAGVHLGTAEGAIGCVAASGGTTDWCRNARTEPAVEVRPPDGGWEVAVEDVGDGPRRLDLVRRVLLERGPASVAVLACIAGPSGRDRPRWSRIPRLPVLARLYAEVSGRRSVNSPPAER